MSNFDPTGILSATTAGVRLVGAVLDVAPRVKKAIDGHSSGGVSAGGEFQGAARGPGENDVTGASTTAPSPATAAQIQSLALQRVDPEKETRAYETVNYVLKTIGTRILEANMVNMGALAAALTAATSHIEVKLFSGETNRLFQSLARKLNDVNLVNSVFTSIYLVGFLTAELTSSLPNYKREYPALGPLMVQQMMRVAIGDDAFRENQTANLNAYHTVATTAGLLKPTDIGYSIFPDFPSLSPTRYSSKSMLDRNSHKNVLEKLVKHFDAYGFPQPLQGRDVGPIRDWRFLSSDSNSRAFEVDKADKQIGSQFGRVLYWLICSAHRMPSGMAVVAYYDQHIALIRYLGPRFGYRVLNTGGDLNMSGPHLQLNKKLRATFDNWVIIMPSESLLAERRLATQQQVQQQTAAAMASTSGPHHSPQMVMAPGVANQQRPDGPSAATSFVQQHNAAAVIPNAGPHNGPVPQRQTSGVIPQSPGSGAGRLSIGSELSSPENRPTVNPNTLAMRPASDVHNESHMNNPPHNVVLWHLNNLDSIYKSAFLPRCSQFISNPPTEPEGLKKEFTVLVEELHSGILPKIEAIDVHGDEPAGLKKKHLTDEVRTTIGKLDAVYREASAAISPPSRPSSVASDPSVKPTSTGDQTLFQVISGASELDSTTIPSAALLQSQQTPQELPGVTGSITGSHHQPAHPVTTSPVSAIPPIAQVPSPVSAASGPLPASPNASPAPSVGPGIASRPSVVRRKAPPPPKKVTLAKALYDFEPEEPEEGGATELAFSEGDIIEIVEKNKTLEEDGWCRARIQGQKKIGLAPLDYLEELPNQPAAATRVSRVSSASTAAAIPEQAEPKPITSAEINVSPSIQTSQSPPNTASPTTHLPSNPNPDQKTHLGPLDSFQEVEQPPPSYASAISQSATLNTLTTAPLSPANNSTAVSPPPGPPSTHHNQSTYSNAPPEKPSSPQPSSSEQAVQPPVKPTQSPAQTSYNSATPLSAIPQSSGSVQADQSYQPPNNPGYRPQMTSQMPQNQYVQQQMFTGNSYASPMLNPGMMNPGRPAGPMGSMDGNLHAYASMAEAASGFAQAGAHIFGTMHGGSHNDTQHNGGSAPGNTYNTNNYYEASPNSDPNPNDSGTAQATSGGSTGNAPNSTTNNNASSSNDYSGGNTTININNNNDYNSTSNTQINQDQSYDGFDGAIPTYYPPVSTSSPQPSGPGYGASDAPPETTSPTNPPGFDYSTPYFPPANSAPTDPGLTSTAPPQDSVYNIPTSLPGDGAATSSNVYATEPSAGSVQYVPDPSGDDTFSTTSLPASTAPSYDLYSSSTFGQDNTGLATTTSPFASLVPASSPDPTYTVGLDSTTVYPTSPFATSASSSDPTYTAGLDSTTVYSTSPFASLAVTGTSDPYSDSGSAYAQAVSPLAGLATPDSTGIISTQDITSGATSPFASLAITDSTTLGAGYFDNTTTVTVTEGVTSPDAVSPLAGLASTTSLDVTATTSTTNAQYTDTSTMSTDNTFGMSNATTTYDFSSSDNNGNWNLTDYSTMADTSSYDYSESFDF